MKRRGSKIEGPDLMGSALRWETARAVLLRHAGRHDEAEVAEQWCSWLSDQLKGELQGLIDFGTKEAA